MSYRPKPPLTLLDINELNNLLIDRHAASSLSLSYHLLFLPFSSLPPSLKSRLPPTFDFSGVFVLFTLPPSLPPRFPSPLPSILGCGLRW